MPGMRKTMSEYKKGTLKSSSGRKVKSRSRLLLSVCHKAVRERRSDMAMYGGKYMKAKKGSKSAMNNGPGLMVVRPCLVHRRIQGEGEEA